MLAAPRAASAWRSENGVRRCRIVGASRPFGRMVHSADFQRALAVLPCSRSAHFALHHVKPGSFAPAAGEQSTSFKLLSTDLCTTGDGLVDQAALIAAPNHDPAPGLLGCLVPKRHAKRSVTRQLFKRLMRATALNLPAPLPPGLWLVRLRQPFPKAAFPSARSRALSQAAGLELQSLWRRVGLTP